MRSIPVVARLYISLVIFLAILVISLSLRFKVEQTDLIWGIILIIVATFAESYNLLLTRNYEVSAHPAVHIAIIFILSPFAALMVVLISIILEQVFAKAVWYKALFNIGHHIIITGIPALLIQMFGASGEVRQLSQHPEFFGGAALVVMVYYLLDITLVDLVIALTTGSPFLKLWKNINRQTILFDLTLPALGIIAALVWWQAPLFCALLLLPIAVNRFAMKSLRQLEEETKQAIFTITELVEARDPYTFGHSLRVGEYCRLTALELGLDEEQVEMIALAGRVHDLGKIGISDAILNKPGKLNEVEWEEMRRHPTIGAQILEKYSFYKEGVKLVLHHHERWDGQGYPKQIAGEAIPLGARIIAVADAYDAMTTDRPYRRGMPHEQAMAILREGRNTQWDAIVTDAFDKTIQRERLKTEPKIEAARPKAFFPSSELSA